MIEVIKNNSDDIVKGKSYYKRYFAPDIPEKVSGKIINNFDSYLNVNDIIGFFDTTLFDTSNGGLLFTTDGFYYKFIIKAAFFEYKDIDFMRLESDTKLVIFFKKTDKKAYDLIEHSLDVTTLKKVVEALKEIEDTYNQGDSIPDNNQVTETFSADSPEPEGEGTSCDGNDIAGGQTKQRPLKAYEGAEKYIFISYAHRDSNQVFPIMRKLQDEGYKIWYDDGIDPGNEWDDEIAEHIMASGLMLAFISENYINSENCKDELNFARDKKIDRILIYIEDTELPLGMQMRLKRQQSISYFSYEDKADFYEKLFKAEGFEMLK